jgi:hypothetical protein
MKKSELRQMIREVLKEELSKHKTSYIKEALDTYSKKERYQGIDDLVKAYNIKVDDKLIGDWPKIRGVFHAVRDDSSRDILIQVDKSVDIIEARKVLGALFVDFRFTTGYEDMFHDELFWVLEPNNDTIAFWHGRLDDMDIPSGLTDDDMDTLF